MPDPSPLAKKFLILLALGVLAALALAAEAFGATVIVVVWGFIGFAVGTAASVASLATPCFTDGMVGMGAFAVLLYGFIGIPVNVVLALHAPKDFQARLAFMGVRDLLLFDIVYIISRGMWSVTHARELATASAGGVAPSEQHYVQIQG
mmetsp:Transcript_96255/g.310788  ORF Transcript_96255/g.310788 Transcript_96255/m.310788 type:complete len:149 (-) Transcript_96255:74-520(-)